MTTRDFAYWLQGFFEIHGKDEMTPEQIKIVKNHLNLVFKHDIDPSFGLTKEQEKERSRKMPARPIRRTSSLL